MFYVTRNIRWSATGLLALITLLMVAAIGTGGSPANASVPGAKAVPGQAHKGQPLENGPAVSAPPRYTTAPSERVINDPHWRAPNVRANTDTTLFAQQEPSIGVNPLNPLNIVVANKDERTAPGPGTDTKQVWIETSTDGGLTWPVQMRIPGSGLPNESDPVVNFSDNNTVYLTVIGLVASNIGSNTTQVARSTDGGITWGNAVSLDPGLGGSDKEWTAVDTNPASPFYHRVYTTWTNFSAGPTIIEKWSSDNGVTWNPPGGTNYVTVSYGSFDGGQFSMPVVLPNGTVVVTWNTFGNLAVARSTDGGQTFANPNIAGPGITQVNSVPGSNWRINTIPSTAASQATGTIVSVWADGRNGKDDTYFSRSTDNGLTWGAAARVAHNAAGASYQIEPWVSVAPNGRFDVIWYDDRDFMPSNPNTFHIYATHSTDDGATWTGPDEMVTDASTNLNIGIPTGLGWNAAAGDYIGVTSFNEGAYAVWTDTRSGTNEDVYTSLYSPTGGGTPTPTPTVCPTCTNTPTRTATGTPTPTQCVAGYAYATSTGTIVPGTTDTGNHGDDVVTNISLPFPFSLYGAGYTTANVASNGNLQFLNSSTAFTNACLPATALGPAIMPHWDDLRTDTTGSCTGGCGIYTSVSGTAPNRIFNIEWRAYYFTGAGNANFEIRLYEGTNNFDIVLGTVDGGATSATIGVQDGGANFAQFECNTSASNNTRIAFQQLHCDATNTPTVTWTPGSPGATSTRTRTSTPTISPIIEATFTPTRTPIACGITFSDVHPSDYFYTAVQYLACRAVISGYSDGTFRPFNNTTRGQLTKIVVLAEGWAQVCTTQTFSDVPPSHTFYCYVETAVSRGIISGYADGTFKPGNDVTRGQLTKIVVLAEGWANDCATQHFSDVPPTHPFYCFVETAFAHGIISGYADGTFRPGNSATRGQISKIVYEAVTGP